MRFKLGLIVNPLAGLGGSVALKGSDGAQTAAKAIALGAEPKANLRTRAALEQLLAYREQLCIYTVNDSMGEQVAKELGFDVEVVYHSERSTTAQDTELAAKALQAIGVDLLLFAGGDGTARNICHAIDDALPALGIPAGCKIHSGVYAITPKAAGRVVEMLVKGELVTLSESDVMDIDEQAFRQGAVRAKRYGELRVPSELRYVQAVKNAGGKEVDELVLADIAAFVVSEMDEQYQYIMGSGSTVAAVMEEMGLENTLLGVDLVQDQALIGQDMTAQQLLSAVEQAPTKLVITLIGGQGHLFGRGNQQLSPALIRAIGKDNIIVVATKSKLQALQGRPLVCDTGDSELDDELSGYIQITTGFNDHVLYAVGHFEE
ncbi:MULTISPECIES: ATP-NAD kinase family protein [Pseudoalteromonas]|uniref:ATP-NAD kinase n=1 Tax=Pseudoalteromonas ruthenica TaxID=151081 RepID=A0A0F4Q0F1_9GAMM|nr:MULTISPECIES: ATP-NAD kinase family protein [Pseudoalteromonas]KJZ00840.1 ATP-NAD kinase [Pseudoalteromonas ruthenica]KJZ01107.1 ATP-NAD kinase [Pseudoalteromonas ruthenica]MCF2863126.1 ATP-NAD kinase family protein [Pseudoalteromonas sp. CNAT2-18]MCG7559278.1 ATP-NAD kinase family protein [Pseudoalteromonas sp. CNAT2-18.1]MCG7571347.1 ATP-NAD kinase family protein [Pseudoalteromonas sp. CNC9-20]